ncbi:MDR family NADP-dependent oxidoreductase [Actinomadura coerulea]|uniref:MDR family NADP-dependent oxidoreductase n=1 Tax=Actinomadura coerulea TaxID=46159 RepID=UPI00342D3EFC
MPSSPRTSRVVQLAAVPDGLPGPEHFSVVDAPMPAPADGEVLVRNRYFQVFPALRTLIGGGVKGTPFPPLRQGDPLFGAAIGEVVSAPRDTRLRPGDLVRHWLGWREHAVMPADQCTPLDGTLPDPVAHLGQAGVAYTALARDARVRPGDTVFVTGGAGGVGSLAGQIARLLGAGRVIGSTGSPDKAARLVSELGYDAAVVRDGRPVAGQLAEAAPGGIDVLVDNVGGEQLRAAITAARPGARFVLVGTLAGQLAPDRAGTTAPVEVDTFQLIAKRIEMRGFGGLDDAGDRPEWAERFGAWLRSGDIAFPHVRVAGIENAPRALHELIGGRHLGAVIVEL